MKIAILLTTFNRREKTLACLKSIYAQVLPADTGLEIFLTDDGSKDGTADAVKKEFPKVRVFHGTGSLFWAGGMRHTWKQSLTSEADYFLLLNDDTYLVDSAIKTLLDCSLSAVDAKGKRAIVIGSTIDDTGKLSYGGHRLRSPRFWSSDPVHSQAESVDCDFGNANILLVPDVVVNSIGILSEVFTHGLADYDYTLKAKKAGFKIVVAPGYLGSCIDDHGKNWRSTNVPLKQRLAYLKSPKGLAYKEFLYFIRSHFPLSYPSAFAKLWLKTFFPFLWDSFKKQA